MGDAFPRRRHGEAGTVRTTGFWLRMPMNPW
jgi:hypothetical protein